MSAQDMAASLRTELTGRPLVRLPYFVPRGNMHHAAKLGEEGESTEILQSRPRPIDGFAQVRTDENRRTLLKVDNGVRHGHGTGTGHRPAKKREIARTVAHG